MIAPISDKTESIGVKFSRLQRAAVILELAFSHGKTFAVNEALQTMKDLMRELESAYQQIRDAINSEVENGSEESHQTASAGRNEAAKQQSGNDPKRKVGKSQYRTARNK